MKIGIFGECPGTAAGASLPRLLVSQFLKLIFEMKLQRGSRPGKAACLEQRGLHRGLTNWLSCSLPSYAFYDS